MVQEANPSAAGLGAAAAGPGKPRDARERHKSSEQCQDLSEKRCQVSEK